MAPSLDEPIIIRPSYDQEPEFEASGDRQDYQGDCCCDDRTLWNPALDGGVGQGYCGLLYPQLSQERVHRRRAMIVRLAVLGSNVIHRLERWRTEKYLAALGANFSRNIPENAQLTLPAMNVFDSTRFNRASAIQAFHHVWCV